MSGVSFVSTNAIIYNMVLPTAYEHINKFMHFIFVFILLMLRNIFIFVVHTKNWKRNDQMSFYKTNLFRTLAEEILSKNHIILKTFHLENFFLPFPQTKIGRQL